MSKMGSHDPFGHLKHELWPKERSGIKLTIWLLTIESQKSTQFLCVKVTCDIPLKSSWQGIQLCFRPHLNRRSAYKVMGPQNRENPTLRILVLGQNAIWMWVSWKGTYYTIRGKVMASPKFELWWILWIRVCPWFILAPKVL
jgi:hypothetical protein